MKAVREEAVPAALRGSGATAHVGGRHAYGVVKLAFQTDVGRAILGTSDQPIAAERRPRRSRRPVAAPDGTRSLRREQLD